MLTPDELERLIGAARRVRGDLSKARGAWIQEASSITEREAREKNDYLRHTDRSGRVADFHTLRHGFITYRVKRRR